ncbi:hypothetical protein N7468_003572 [Penicillium chermesinum]|uniref:Myb-like domain-containing protein n=1 Tax=Penicillium chermesinum TaxID=63820 RepID=A0A9W9P6R4_9EURO|nr:uncharacterized protein N7468_003572 [Penicillium chermesinum]KAJ5238953.1 hypothetical protein N7468_003572 [Penicillium chermesinum]KAJ6164596.1 hypothetical protein N7470_003268 [Penicillium chermesinum]
MLLPSAIPCDVRRSSRFTPSRLFSTPPPDRGTAGNGLLGTCRALQSMLNGSPAPSPRRSVKPQRLQSPLPINPPRRSPRSRTRKVARPASPQSTPPPAALASTPPPPPCAPPRGANKRRRAEDDDSDSDMSHGRNRLSTPKRRRQVPYNLPLGLSSADFYSLHSPPITQSPPSPAARRQLVSRIPDSAPINPDAPLPSIEVSDETTPGPSEEWTADEDQRLLEVVLEKFRLSQEEWNECARRVGCRNPANAGRRWNSLVGGGRVILRRSQN